MHKYPVFQVCKVLKISRSTYYAYDEPSVKKDRLNDLVVNIFNENQHVYGTHKLKVELAKKIIKYRDDVSPKS